MRWILPELFPAAFLRRSAADFRNCLGTYYVTLAEWHRTHARPLQQRAYADSALAIAPSAPFALALSGKRAQAIAAARSLLDTRPVERDRRAGPEVLHDLARMYVVLGDVQRALALLEDWAAMPSEQTVEMLHFDPVWTAVRNERRFQDIVARR
jgi:hypothetical protein